jgi:hypothetical protein
MPFTKKILIILKITEKSKITSKSLNITLFETMQGGKNLWIKAHKMSAFNLFSCSKKVIFANL